MNKNSNFPTHLLPLQGILDMTEKTKQAHRNPLAQQALDTTRLLQRVPPCRLAFTVLLPAPFPLTTSSTGFATSKISLLASFSFSFGSFGINAVGAVNSGSPILFSVSRL
jgi:hypothetical protein